MFNGKKSAKITWLNYQEMLKEAEGKNDESFFDMPSCFHDDLENLFTERAMTAWNPCEEFDLVDNQDAWRGSLDVVSFMIDAEIFSWSNIIDYLLGMTKMEKYRQLVLMIVFTAGESSEKTFICNGKFTSVLFDYETGKLIRAF